MHQYKYYPETKALASLALATLCLTTLLSFSACVKKNDPDNANPSNPNGPVATEVQQTSNLAPLLEPEPMKLCVRPAHRLGVKKCVRAGKWVRFTAAANDVDNDRTDVFTNPRISLKKENFYIDTFRFEAGLNHVPNYPDYYHVHAPYGGFAHMIFAMPSQGDPSLTYGYSGRDEIIENRVRPLSSFTTQNKESVKIQHWNDRSTYKKFAHIYFEVIGDYAETNFRHSCSWAEQDHGFEYSQRTTREGAWVPYIPETFIWRKIAESCESLPRQSSDGKYSYLNFREITSNPVTTEHKFTLASRNKIKTFNVKSVQIDEQDPTFDPLNPMAFDFIKSDPSVLMFINSKKEPISRWEAIYAEDLKDLSFQPERTK